MRQPTHRSFGLQWDRFRDVQLDSRNGTTLSRDRLLGQSRLSPDDFQGRSVLEVGCGAGRFTEVMLGFGARVVALDYSTAIGSCASSNAEAVADGRLAVAQADVFALPVRPRSFDIVLGYGMLQHTGDPRRALHALWDAVRPGGLLLVDRYQLSLRHALPFKYAFRPILSRMPPEMVLGLIEKLCASLIPLERRILRRVQGRGPQRYVRYVIARSPNSVFPLNLEIQGKLDPAVAWRWSVLDTFDQYASRYDLPCTFDQWRRQLDELPDGIVVYAGTAGQGNVGVVRRRP